MSEWEETTLGEILELITDYHANGSYETLKENVELLERKDFAIMIRTTNFEQNDFSINLKYINEDAYYFLKKSTVYPGDIIMNKIANAGSVYFMPNLYRPVSLAMNLFLLRVNRQKANQHFIFYYLKINESYVKQFAEGSVTKTITKNAVRNLVIRKPSIEKQNSIVRVIESIENKIDNLRRQNATLEEIARSIFKHWFIDFEFPNPDGKPYKSSGGVMVRSDLGDIPEGWRVGKLGELTKTITKGTTPTTFKKDFVDSGINFIKVESISGDHTLDRSKFAYIDEETNTLLKRSIVQEKDILYTIAGTIGRYVMVTASSLPANTNQAVAIIRPDFDKIDPEYLLCYFASINYKHYLSSRIVQAVQANLSLGVLSDSPVTIPDKKIRNGFREAVKPIFSKKESNQREIQTLSKTRDALLPKLMSGQLRVNE